MTKIPLWRYVLAWISSLTLLAAAFAGLFYLFMLPVEALTPQGLAADEKLPITALCLLTALVWGILTWVSGRGINLLHKKILDAPQPPPQRNAVVWFGLLVIVLSGLWLAEMDEIAHFNILIRKSNEGAAKGNLAAIRAALDAYKQDNKRISPATLNVLTVDGKYLPALPKAKTPNYHKDSASVTLGSAPDDTGGWLYNSMTGSKGAGLVLINCTHTDTKGNSWTSY